MAYFSGTVIYCSPIEAEKVDGYPSLTKTITLTDDAVEAIADYFEAQNEGATLTAGIASGVIGGYLAPVFGTILGGAVLSYAESVALHFIQTNDEVVESIAVNGDNKIKLIYDYRRHGSYDGAWFLDDIELV